MKESRRKYGTGSLRKRGKVWVAQFYADGIRKIVSTQETDLEMAERFLEREMYAVKFARVPIPPIQIATSRRCALGTASELIVSADLLGRGYEVFHALSQHSSCDLIAMGYGKLLRVEVKTASLDGCARVPSHRRAQFDILAVVNRGKQIVYSPDLATITPFIQGDSILESPDC